jgi:CspA family cold shock protein
MSIKSIAQAICRLFSCRHKQKQQGTIKFFDRKKRFGFIVADKQEYFFHATSAKPQDFKLLRDGVHVLFVITQGKKGPQADKIELI